MKTAYLVISEKRTSSVLLEIPLKENTKLDVVGLTKLLDEHFKFASRKLIMKEVM